MSTLIYLKNLKVVSRYLLTLLFSQVGKYKAFSLTPVIYILILAPSLLPSSEPSLLPLLACLGTVTKLDMHILVLALYRIQTPC